MPVAIFVSQFDATPIGHGGNHRAYQIMCDLEQLFEKSNVVFVSWEKWKQLQPPLEHSHSRLRLFARQIKPLYQLVQIGRHFYEKIRKIQQLTTPDHSRQFILSALDSKLTKNEYTSDEFVLYYEKIISQIDHPAYCIIEHASFFKLVDVNKRYKIKTISCIQNIESFDTVLPLNFLSQSGVHLASLEFANEMQILFHCDERLFISKVEAGLVSGLGLSSHFYPYRPVNIIRQKLIDIRQTRTPERIVPGLFLMLGSASHKTTFSSFSWFLENARLTGLPTGVRVVIAGSRTEQLLPPEVAIPGIELRGWIEQEELNKLFVHTQAVLMPQILGFGALTRLPEISCAGIVGVVSKHPTYAVDLPPGIVVVDDNWDAWYQKMAEIVSKPPQTISESEYCFWERCQSNPLETVLK